MNNVERASMSVWRGRAWTLRFCPLLSFSVLSRHATLTPHTFSNLFSQPSYLFLPFHKGRWKVTGQIEIENKLYNRRGRQCMGHTNSNDPSVQISRVLRYNIIENISFWSLEGSIGELSYKCLQTACKLKKKKRQSTVDSFHDRLC